jgi:hypothetical protein
MQLINREDIDPGQYRIFLHYSYSVINEIYHQTRNNQVEYSWRHIKFQLAGTQAELAGTQAELAGTQAELAGTQAELAGILKSRTWRFFSVYRKFR